jgi:LPS sulfotransferase NodH
VGFKVTVSQLLNDAPGLLDWFERQAPLDLILLDRRSALRRFVSYQLARKRGRWHSTRELDAPPPPVRVRPRAFRTFLERKKEQDEALRELFERRGHRVLELDYETLVAERNQTVDRTVRFLGLQPVERYEAATVKLTQGRLEDLISNFDEIAKRFPKQLDRSEG